MSRPDDSEAGDDEDADDTDVRGESADGRAANERGGDVPALLLLVGVGLFVFPEPITSYVGATLAAVGALAWFVRFALG